LKTEYSEGEGTKIKLETHKYIIFRFRWWH